MRAVLCVTLLLLLSLDQGVALKCNYCYSKGSELCSPTSVQICSGMANACGTVWFQSPLSYSYRQCMNMAVCQGFITTPGVIASCCSTDLCN